MTLTPSEAHVGEPVAYALTGFAEGALRVTIDAVEVPATSGGAADGAGTRTGSLVLPDLSPGAHPVCFAAAAEASHCADITVLATAAPPTPSTTPTQTPVPTPTAAPAPTPSATPAVTPSATASATPSAIPGPTPSSSPARTSAPAPRPTSSPARATPSASPQPTATTVSGFVGRRYAPSPALAGPLAVGLGVPIAPAVPQNKTDLLPMLAPPAVASAAVPSPTSSSDAVLVSAAPPTRHSEISETALLGCGLVAAAGMTLIWRTRKP